MERKFEAYSELPLDTQINSDFELNKKDWFIQIGSSPESVRKYNFVEFVFFCGKNQELFDRF